jgi:hypothetical protein
MGRPVSLSKTIATYSSGGHTVTYRRDARLVYDGTILLPIKVSYQQAVVAASRLLNSTTLTATYSSGRATILDYREDQLA